MYSKTFNIFNSESFDVVIESINNSIFQEIRNQSDNYILNVNEIEYTTYLYHQYKIPSIDIHFDLINVSDYQAEIPAEAHPRSFHVRPGKNYTRQVIRFHIPFSGPKNLLKYKPYPEATLWTHPVYILNDEICFDLTNFDNNQAGINQNKEEIIRHMSRQFEYLKSNISEFNNSLKDKIRGLLISHKNEILTKNKFLSSLGVPVKKVKNLPESYSIPIFEREEIKIPEPVVTEKGYRPEPLLDNSIYIHILKIIYDVGKVFERLPATYNEKKEEDLRDHLLLYLQPRFSMTGSATGETFNKSGKTDILIQYQNSNVFVAECKIWSGSKNHQDALDQLLKYLTWRDSKAALIVFVHNKNFSNVLNEIKQSTPTHTNYLGYVDESSDTWFNYRFHINDDKNREVKLAILTFHIPE